MPEVSKELKVIGLAESIRTAHRLPAIAIAKIEPNTKKGGFTLRFRNQDDEEVTIESTDKRLKGVKYRELS